MVLRVVSAVVILALALGWVCGGTWCGRTARAVAVGMASPFLMGAEEGEERLNAGLSWAGGGWAGRERAELERRVGQLEVIVADLREAARERDELRNLLELPQTSDWKVVFAPVVARDVLDWGRGFRIGKGRADGISPGCAVVVVGCVVGRVMDCTEGTSMVAAVTGGASRIGVTAVPGGAAGVVSGGGSGAGGKPGGPCWVQFLSRDVRVAPGAILLTSGLGMDIPAGLAVGRVAGGEGEAALLARIQQGQSVQMIPAGDPDSVRYVGIVLARHP